jgi:DUF1680 family protein
MHVSTKQSGHATWRSLPVGGVRLDGGFWASRQEVNRRVSLRHGYAKLQKFGNLHDLELAAQVVAGKASPAEVAAEFRGPVFMDSDVYKWLEAASLDLANGPDAEVSGMIEHLTGLLEAAQQPDGYLNSYWQVVKAGQRWTDLQWGHEMYCAGHLIEAAVANHRATGGLRLLAIAQRFADYVGTVFGPGKRDGLGGHPEIELALVELYRETGERRYLDLAVYFINRRGRSTFGKDTWASAGYFQDRVPVREATEVEGHAVRQLYLASGVTDAYLETGEAALLEAMSRLWVDMAAHKTHLTGGFGARHEGEAFGDTYELPSDRCYCETCASIAAMMWNWRMLLATGEARYADLLERSLYNGFLSGVSLDGQRYFYVNPLMSRGGIERPEWYGCACCPPNVMRQIALVGNYVATTGETGVQLHQYMPARFETEAGAVLSLDTAYPWDGTVKVTVEATPAEPWTLSLRIPAWAEGASVCLGGEPLDVTAEAGTYATITRAWQAGDVVELDLPMQPRLTAANPRVDALRGSLALERGPIVYCLEDADQEPGVDLLDVRLCDDPAPVSQWQGDLLGGVVMVEARGAVVTQGDWEAALYRPAGAVPAATPREVPLRAVPYFAWANRGPGAMRVWVPEE